MPCLILELLPFDNFCTYNIVGNVSLKLQDYREYNF